MKKLLRWLWEDWVIRLGAFFCVAQLGFILIMWPLMPVFVQNRFLCNVWFLWSALWAAFMAYGTQPATHKDD